MNNEDQIAYWNGEAGAKWVQHSQQLDGLLAPFLPEILSRAALNEGEHILDIGCGGGALTLEAARRVGPQRGAVGVDVSKPLLALAKTRAKAVNLPATFVCEDASVYRAAQPLDAAVSRFGVLFFADPAAAFDALRRNLPPEGRLVFACWQGLEHNDWASLALKTALPFLDAAPPQPDPHAPGPFAFADAKRVTSLLTDAGWRGVSAEPWTGTLALPGNTATESADFLLRMGPMARLLSEPDIDHAAIHGALTERLAATQAPDGQTKLPAAIWLISATAS